MGGFGHGGDAADVGDQVAERLGEAFAVGEHLHGGGVHRVADPAGADQVAGPLDGQLHDLVQADPFAVQRGLAAVGGGLEALVFEHALDEPAEAAALVGEPAQRPVGLGPELSGGVGGELVDPAVQRAERAAEFGLQDGGEVLVACGEGEFVGAVGERHDRADELFAVPDRGGGQVDGDGAAVLAPQHGVADPVLAAGVQGVHQRRTLGGQRAAVGLGVLDQRVQFAAAELAGPEVEDVRGGRVDQHHAALQVDAEDTLGGGPQDHLGLLVLAPQFGLHAEARRQVADQEQQQVLVGGGEGQEAVRLPAALVLEVVPGHLDGEGGAVGASGGHPDRW